MFPLVDVLNINGSTIILYNISGAVIKSNYYQVKSAYINFKVFAEIFESYQDFPTALLGCPDGHMSFGAFLRFLVDFNMFPQIITYAEVQEVYQTVESCLYVSKSAESDRQRKMLSNVCVTFRKNCNKKALADSGAEMAPEPPDEVQKRICLLLLLI